MTATLPQRGPSTPGGLPRVRLDARPGYVYGYRIRDPHTNEVRIDYVGQTRNLDRRDGQHRGLLPQRDGVVREQPWADLIDDSGGHQPVVLERGIWTDTDLDGRELAWMAHLLPRMNCKDSVTPDRIPIYVQQRERDQRDIANGLPPRDWSRPSPSRPVLPRPQPSTPVPFRPAGVVARRAKRAAQVAAAVAGVWIGLWLAATLYLHQPVGQAAETATSVMVGTAALYAAWTWRRRWWPHVRPARRRGRRTTRRRSR